MALRISVDLDGLRWADLFRFVELARSGGASPTDQVDVRTFGTDGAPVSLTAKIFTEGTSAPAPTVASPASPTNGQHYTAFDRAARTTPGLSQPQVDSTYVDEFPRHEEGLTRSGLHQEEGLMRSGLHQEEELMRSGLYQEEAPPERG